MKVQQVTCKTALSASSLPGLEYSLNPYRGCQHSCAYCYVPNVLHMPRETYGSVVEVKDNIPVVLAKELPKKKPGVVGLSTVTDPYQPVESTYKLTRYCLEQLVLFDFPVCIQTKSSLVRRDFDLIRQLSSCEIMMSIGTMHDTERSILEPFASSIPERISVLKECAEHGIKSSVFFGPIYPSVHEEDIRKILDVCKEHKVSYMLLDRLNLKRGIWESIRARTQHDSHDMVLLKSPEEYAVYVERIREEFIRIGNEKTFQVLDAF